MHALDVTVLLWFNRILGGNWVVAEIAYYLDECASTIIVSMLVMYFLFETRNSKDAVRLTVLMSGLAAILALITAYGLASVTDRSHPFVALNEVWRRISPDRDSSFPSIVTVWSAAAAAIMFRVSNKLIGFVFVVMALLVGASRLVLGVHWPSDIVASFLIGFVSSRLAVAMSGLLSPITHWVLRATHLLFVAEGRTMVPVRAAAEALGAQPAWNAATQEVTLTRDGHKVVMAIGKPEALVDGTSRLIDPNNRAVVPVLKEGRTFVPIRFLADALGAELTWDPAAESITLTIP